jgi:Transposase DDE domain group 1
MKSSARSSRVAVSAEGRGLVSQAGAVLLWETLRVTGLGRGLSAAPEPWRAPRAVHDPGKIVADLAAALALGGDCLADIAVLRGQPALAGPVASDPMVSGWSVPWQRTGRGRWRRSGPRGRQQA